MNEHVNIFDFEIAAAAAQPGGDGVWMRLIPSGTFKLRDGRGPFNAGDRAELQRIVDRTVAHLGATELMVDYDHQAVFGAIPNVGGRAEAAGWIKQLEVRDDGIWGLVDWTADAAAKIAAKAYRYISPLFTSNKAGRVGRLANVALVNMPALDLTAVAAASKLLIEREPDDMNAIAKALGLADGASSDAILAALNDRHVKIAAAAGLKADASLDAIVTAVAAAVAGMGTIAAAAGLEAGAGADEVVAAMARSVPMAMVTELQSQVKTLTEKLDSKDVEDVVSAAVAEGKIPPANEAWARNYAKADLDGFKAFVANAPVLTKVQLGDGKQVAASQELDAGTIAARAQAYQAEQAKVGITVSISAAVDHVQAQASK